MQANFSDTQRAERMIVMQVLRDDHSEWWTRAELKRAASDIIPDVVEEALQDLASQGVVLLDDDEAVAASLGTRRLDVLGLVGI
jgi:peptide subunit release factor 1 (eRF1)